MSKIKVSKTVYVKGKQEKKEWPVVVYLWIIGLALFSYLVARFTLDTYPHPYHWVSGLVGGVTGVPIGWVWYRWRGDVF